MTRVAAAVYGALFGVLLGVLMPPSLFLERLAVQPLGAQTTSYDIGVFATGVDPNPPTNGQSVIPIVNFLKTAATCGQPKNPNSVLENPTMVIFDDPAAPLTQDCIFAAASFFQSVPYGTGYRAGVRPKTPTVGAWALSSPFASVAPAVVPVVTGVRVR